MGGAYVAISDDPSGLYYNPAGIEHAASSNLSGSMNAFHITNTKYHNVLNGGDWERSSSVLLPNFFGVIQPLGKGTLGFSYAVTDAILEDQDQTFYDIAQQGSKFHINFNNQDTTYNIGPSYALSLFSKKLNIGLSVYGHYRVKEQIFNQLFEVYSAADTKTLYEWTNSYFHSEEYGVKPILGVMISPFDKLSLGATISKTILLNASSQTIKAKIADCSTVTEADPNKHVCQLTPIERSQTSSDYVRDLPLNVNIGLAYFPTPALVISADTNIYEPLWGQKLPLVNASVGAEYYVSGGWALRSGFFSNLANTPVLKTTKSSQLEKIDFFGLSLSVTRFTRSTSLSFGMTQQFGAGKAQVVSGSSAMQNVSASTTTGFLSASYSY